MQKNIFSLVLGILFLVSCTVDEEPIRPQPVAGTLANWQTLTPSPSPPPPTPFLAETPLPTATPFLYTVVSGDSMSDIAFNFGISLDVLLAANPDVSPSAMSVGQELRVPSGDDDILSLPTPAPVDVNIVKVNCYPVAPQGMWCFALAQNDGDFTLENISAQVSLVDSDGEKIASQTSFLLLDILRPQEALPLIAFFDSAPIGAQPTVQILTAIELSSDDEHYLPAILQNTIVEIDWSGKTAQVRGDVVFPVEDVEASLIWVAATAYDAAGNVVGVRRWEWDGASKTFDLTVASLGHEIEHVLLSVEAMR